MTNTAGAFSDITGIWGLVHHYGPPLGSAMVVPLQPWLPENLPTEIRVDALSVWIRLAVWTTAGLGALAWTMRRAEFGR